MLFVIHTVDRPGCESVRATFRSEHLHYLQLHAKKIWASGGLFAERSSQAAGGLIIVDLENRAAAQDFVDSDPFTQADLFRSVEIHAWKRSFQDGQFHAVPL